METQASFLDLTLRCLAAGLVAGTLVAMLLACITLLLA